MNGEHSKARQNLVSLLQRYVARYPAETASFTRYAQFIMSNPRCFERDSWLGHVTGSAWLVDASGERVLLTHHRKLNKWLQLGGHSDGHPIPLEVALREATEESGVEVEPVATELFDVDIHEIPARKSDPTHFSLRSAVCASSQAR